MARIITFKQIYIINIITNRRFKKKQREFIFELFLLYFFCIIFCIFLSFEILIVIKSDHVLNNIQSK